MLELESLLEKERQNLGRLRKAHYQIASELGLIEQVNIYLSYLWLRICSVLAFVEISYLSKLYLSMSGQNGRAICKGSPGNIFYGVTCLNTTSRVSAHILLCYKY